MSVSSKMTAIADKIRTLLGISGAMGLDAMATNLGNAVNEVDTQDALIQQIKTVLAGKAIDGSGVKRAIGTCTGDDVNGYVYVTLGFKPDIVMFPDFGFVNRSGYVHSCAVAWFTENPECIYCEVCAHDFRQREYIIYPVCAEDGFFIEDLYALYDSGNGMGEIWQPSPGETLRYIALKYTQ